ncbi:cell division protein FtsI [Enemella dayhoffiae]|uniref:Cell division protein FtsI n=1 Tax=Enemella dayhoffiae TaxID=2016507 RepID=A0A255HB33_9ACTN|nr:penicillin-binding protein 2 [Enemella dayhoffiae]OYO25088.1 cell division protein FtsI [Enemella dayhoffiae]
MNRPIRRVAIVAMLMFGLLLANGTFTMVVRQDSLNANAQNRRTRDEEFAQDRGPIMAGQTQIAQTAPSKDQFQFQRSYPEAKLYAPITGYYSYDHARSGLEASMNRELAGTADSQLIRRVLDTVTGQKPTGASVETTINPKAQRAAAEALGNRKGAVVAMDPRTGAVLAMVTSPSYDPNLIASHDIRAANRAYQDLASDTDRPMANRAAREIYPPGSIFKLVTAAAALENGRRPEGQVASPERLRLPQTSYDLTNDSDCGGANVTIDQALKVSCNTAFANLGLELGADKLRAQAEKFGFGSRPLTELNAVASRYPDNPNLPETALTAIGQHDVAATPLQMTMVTSAIANNGDLYEPYLVSTVRGSNLTPIETRKPRLKGRTMSADNAKLLAEMMQHVVTDGTGQNAQIRGVKVGGKTGTAQSDPKRPPYAWFTSYALDSSGQPAVAVTAFVEDANIQRSDIAGGRVAAPIAKSVMEAVL